MRCGSWRDVFAELDIVAFCAMTAGLGRADRAWRVALGASGCVGGEAEVRRRLVEHMADMLDSARNEHLRIVARSNACVLDINYLRSTSGGAQYAMVMMTDGAKRWARQGQHVGRDVPSWLRIDVQADLAETTMD